MSLCFAPNCEATEGLPFPDDPGSRQKLLDKLELTDARPADGDFLCDKHFNERTDGADPEDNPPEKLPETTEPEENPPIIKKEQPETTTLPSCLICLENSDSTRNIATDFKICNIINKCLHPFNLDTKNEKETTQNVCSKCYNVLDTFHTFRQMCFAKHNLEEGKDKYLSEFTNNLTSKKRKLNEELDAEIERQLDEMENGIQEHEDLDSDVTFDSDNPEDYNPPPPKVTVIDKPKVEEKKFGQVEEDLRKVLEGHLSQEQIAAENIIIAVESDEEANTTKTSISQIKLPIIIKPLNKTTKAVPQFKNKIIRDEVKPKQKIPMKDGLVLPKGISVTVAEKFESDVGVYEAVPKPYLFNSEFCLVDNYLYEYRLCKGYWRYLRCILQTCYGYAVQNKISNAEFSSEVTVKEPHNHPKPTEKEMKKQMFYHVMKRMMQNDKSMNFKSVYEEVCQKDPEIRTLIPLRNVINEICRHQLSHKTPPINTFEEFYGKVEDDTFKKLHFTHSGKQFYQEKFETEDDSKAVVFANSDIIDLISHSKLMYVDASFRIETTDSFQYQLVSILVWVDDSYYPILFALVNKKTQEIYKKILEYLHDFLAPQLRPEEIVTDYEANLYYALGETYLDSHIGGSVFYYTQNLYKKICSLNLSRDLETNSYFRNIYHMLLMLPLLPVNTILDGLNNIEIQAKDLGFQTLTEPIFEHIRTQWIQKVTPDLFCVHRLENRINENVIAPFKKLRDFLMLTKGKLAKHSSTIVGVVEKLIELESFLQVTYATPNKKSFARDLSSSQKKNVLKAWQFIESHPKININNFFTKVLGYIKCMENQLWIWGFYRYTGDVQDDLINASNFLIVANDLDIAQNKILDQEGELVDAENSVVMEAVIDENGGFVLQTEQETGSGFENNFLRYVYKE